METKLHEYFRQLPDPRITRNKKHLLIDIVILSNKDSFHEKSPIHIISAWANSNQLVLCQCKVDNKSNEITAIPKLLELLNIEGCLVTVNAIGTQKKIAETIIGQKANYILALKGNQSSLQEDVAHIFSRRKPDSQDTSIEKGHERIETRNCQVINNLTFMDDKGQWEKLTSQREINGKVTDETRLYISSVADNAKNFNSFIRQHWGIENSLHWTLDVIFNADHQRKRNGMATQNFALVQKNSIKLA